MLFKKFVVRTGLSFGLGVVLLCAAFRGLPPVQSINMMGAAVIVCNGLLTIFKGD